MRNSCSLRHFVGMPYPENEFLSLLDNRLICEELGYDSNSLVEEFDSQFSSLTDEQKNIYNCVIKSVEEKKGGVFFVYGYGGTGKTFLWKTLSSSIRYKRKIVLNVASSGIASLLLAGGRTTHSRFRIPINLTEDSMCYIPPNSDVAQLVKQTDLIIWDEAPMTHKHAFEALDRSLKDVFGVHADESSDLLFGGKVVVFGGDFRQILPVVPNGTRHDIVNASLSSSYIWHKCTVLELTKNMRLLSGSCSSDIEETKKFASWLLDIGEGKVDTISDDQDVILIPDDLLISQSSDPVSDLIAFVYPSLLDNIHIPTYFQDRAILAPKNEVVQEINDRLLLMFPGEEIEYLSSDSVCQSEDVNEKVDESLISPDILNGLKLFGIPNHRLVL